MKSKKKTKSSKRSPEKRLSIMLPVPDKKPQPSPSPQSPQKRRIVKKRRLYSRESLQAAYKAVKDSNISVNAAAKQFGVPLTTLRDRVDGRISIDTTRPGPPLLMTKEEESDIAHFLHTMARYGYRYTRLELAEIATDLAVEKGKRDPRSNGLTTKWVDSFIHRWPSIKDLSCKLKNKLDAEHTVRTYFDEIKKIIDRYKLLEKSDRIFNIMEITLSTDHGIASTGKSGHPFKTENYTNTTVIACGSVSGRVIPPFFVFQASKLRPDMMKGMPVNVNASVSESGKCSPQIFRRYLNEHFLPNIYRGENEPILILMDGSRSHVFVGMSEWGRANNVIFSFVPAHTTHLLQPLEVDCAEALKKKYDSARRRFMKLSMGPYLFRNNIGEIACQAYAKVVTRSMLIHSFKKAGVYPDISSDESDNDADNSEVKAYNGRILKSEESMEILDEIVFTGDLVVGQNQEVTEEEVVSTQEVVLSDGGTSEEMVVGPDGQFVLTPAGAMVVGTNGHIVFHDGEIFINSSDGAFSHLQLIPSVEGLSESSPTKSENGCVKISPIKQCMIGDEHLLTDTSLDLDMDSHLHSTDSLNSSENVSDDKHLGVKIEMASDMNSFNGDSESGQSDESSAGISVIIKCESHHLPTL